MDQPDQWRRHCVYFSRIHTPVTPIVTIVAIEVSIDVETLIHGLKQLNRKTITATPSISKSTGPVLSVRYNRISL